MKPQLPSSSRQDFRLLVPLPVRWGDVDRLGHVNNVQILRYCEEARVNWIEQLMPAAVRSRGEGPILADIHCSFLRQLRWPAQLEIGARATRLGGSSLTLINAVFEAGEPKPVAIARAVMVWFDYKAQRSKPLPDSLRQAIKNFEVLTPEE